MRSQDPIYFAPPSGRSLALWLKSRTVESPSGCWDWTGAQQGVGYGFVPAKMHKSRYAHRAMYEAVCSPIPSGYFVLHSCDNPRCINPAHLMVGTHKDNMRDRDAKGRTKLPPHTCGQKQPAAKMTDETVIAARRDVANGMKQKDAAAKYGIGITTMYYIVKRLRWRHV
ncbi:MAG: HNH endonuclease [Sulfuricaulis sp.]|nr:HNH endonuclease [Sulfuricaulis sp.]